MRISTATRSPARTPQRAAVSSVISSMMPRGSWPGIIGSPRVPMAPLYCSTSLPQMPQASTRSSAPVSPPSTGRGYSRISICRGPVCTTARTMSAKGRTFLAALGLALGLELGLGNRGGSGDSGAGHNRFCCPADHDI
jgi:hypothetical protein